MGLEGSCGGYFLHTLFTFALGPEKGFGISPSLTWGRLCHSHGTETLGCFTWLCHVNNKHSLRTSLVPCRPTILYVSPNSVPRIHCHPSAHKFLWNTRGWVHTARVSRKLFLNSLLSQIGCDGFHSLLAQTGCDKFPASIAPVAFWQYSKLNFNCIFLNQLLYKNVCVCACAHVHTYMHMHTDTCSHVPMRMNMLQHACGGQRANFLESVLSFHNRTRDQIPVIRLLCQASFIHPKVSLWPNLMLLTFAWKRCTKSLSGPTKGCLSDLRLQRGTNSGWLDGRLMALDGFCCGLVSLYYCFMRLKKKGSLRLSQINLFSKHWDISQINFV